MATKETDPKKIYTKWRDGLNLPPEENYILTRAKLSAPGLANTLAKTASAGVAADACIELALATYKENRHSLAECDWLSVERAVIEGSMMGLPVGQTWRGWMVPRRQKGQARAIAIPDYRGLIHLAVQNPEVRNVEVKPVFTGESFTVTETATGTEITHEPDWATQRDWQKDLLFLYVKVVYTSGSPQIIPCNADYLKRVRAMAGTQTIWNKWPEPMYAKSGIKYGFKQVPAALDSPEILRAVQLDDGTARGVSVKPAPQVEEQLSDIVEAGDFEREGHEPYGVTEAEEPDNPYAGVQLRRKNAPVPISKDAVAAFLKDDVAGKVEESWVLAQIQQRYPELTKPSSSLRGERGLLRHFLGQLLPAQLDELRKTIKT